jgi:hypothetical protein
MSLISTLTGKGPLVEDCTRSSDRNVRNCPLFLNAQPSFSAKMIPNRGLLHRHHARP